MRRPNALFLFRMGAALLVVAALLIGGTALLSAQRQSAVADESLQRLHAFAVAFEAFNSLAAERGPSEAAMAATDPVGAEHSHKQMMLARGASDRAIEQVRKTVGDTLSFNFNFLIAKIRTDRARLDRLLAEPPEIRRLGDELSLVREMIAVGETAEPMLSKLARYVIEADPQIAGDVNLVRLLASLEQAAWRLPSEVLPTFAKHETLRADLLSAAQRTQQRILALWDLGSTQLLVNPDEQEMGRQLDFIRAEYFGRGYPYLTRLIERQAQRPNPTLSSRDVRAVYEPTVKHLTNLRNLFMQKMMAEATARQVQAFWTMVTVAVLCTVLVGTLIALTVLAYRQVLRPLLRFRSQIMAISEREAVAFERYAGDVPQLKAISRALETLRRRDGEREVLERDRVALSERLALLASTDELTGLLNRRGFYEALLVRSPSEARAFVLVDIDHFKLINDRHGHAVGDQVLRQIGAWLCDCASPHVVAARYGGEEFALVLTGPAACDVLARMEDLRAKIEARAVETGEAGPSLHLTASFGVAIASEPDESWEELARMADLALYDAKRSGRNRVRATNRILSRHPATVVEATAPETALVLRQIP